MSSKAPCFILIFDLTVIVFIQILVELLDDCEVEIDEFNTGICLKLLVEHLQGLRLELLHLGLKGTAHDKLDRLLVETDH